jgi:hypothetical protein
MFIGYVAADPIGQPRGIDEQGYCYEKEPQGEADRLCHHETPFRATDSQ